MPITRAPPPHLCSPQLCQTNQLINNQQAGWRHSLAHDENLRAEDRGFSAFASALVPIPIPVLVPVLAFALAFGGERKEEEKKRVCLLFSQQLA